MPLSNNDVNLNNKVESEQNSKRFAFEIVGACEDSFAFPVLPSGPLDEISVDWKKLGLINSSGIARWLRWVHDVRTSQPGVLFTFHHCPTFLVHIINSVNGFLPKGGQVRSFDVPFIRNGNDLDVEEIATVTLGANGPHPSSIDEIAVMVSTSERKNETEIIELDTLPSYFNFLFHRK